MYKSGTGAVEILKTIIHFTWFFIIIVWMYMCAYVFIVRSY